MTTFNTIVSLLDRAGYTPRSYSGRGICGARCLSVNLSRGHSAAEVVARVLEQGLSKADEESRTHGSLMQAVGLLGELAQELAGAKEDSMGLGSVVYWESIKWEADDADDENEDEEP